MVGERSLDTEPPPRPWRLSSRLLLVDDNDRLLLIRAYDPREPAGGEWWEVPGGGVELGEDTAAAAVRETAEETGYRVPLDRVGPPCWTGDVTYRWARRRWWSSIVMHLAGVDHPLDWGPHQRLADEESCFVEVGWVALAHVQAGRRYFPGSLAADLPRLLAGERVDAPFSRWN